MSSGANEETSEHITTECGKRYGRNKQRVLLEYSGRAAYTECKVRGKLEKISWGRKCLSRIIKKREKMLTCQNEC